METNKNGLNRLAVGEIDNAIEILKNKGLNAEVIFAKVIEKLKLLIPFYATVVITNETGKKRSLCGRVTEIDFNEKDGKLKTRILNDGYTGPGEKEFILNTPLDNLLQIIFHKQAKVKTEESKPSICEKNSQPVEESNEDKKTETVSNQKASLCQN